MKRRALLSCCFCLSLTLGVTQSQHWTDLPESSFRSGEGRKHFPERYRTVRLNTATAREFFNQVPNESEVSPAKSAFLLEVPNPDGTMDRFRMVEFDMMEPGLAARYPELKTYRGIDVENPLKTIRCNWTINGFSAMISGDGGRYFIEPYAKGNTEDYLVFHRADYPGPKEPFACHTETDVTKDQQQQRLSGDCMFRTYRLAFAASGEYSNHFGADNVSEEEIVLSEVVIAMNRVNGVFEKDVAVRMILVENTTETFYYNPATDPFTSGCGTLLDQCQNTIDDEIGSANYDIGHLFSVGGGGCAVLECICVDGLKANGQTGTNPPDGDLFYIDYVAHEMGHQFGGGHTQYNSCNRSNASSYEPGSASTIMGYAGICAPNVQNNSDDYFHGISIQQINAFLTDEGSDCDAIISWDNNAPELTSGSDYVIPKSTPFMLTAVASDDDGDPLTYCWEQWNRTGNQTQPPLSTNTLGPMFRSVDPATSPTRFFPNLPDVVNNINPTWEVLPSGTRDMEFRITVRDYHDGLAGCTDEDNINVNTTNNAGPFLVTFPNTSSHEWTEGETENVTWNVASTNVSPVNAPNVNIYLSYDGGFTYPVTLATNVTNDGSHSVVVPNGTSTTARVMVRGANHVFYDISNQNFEIRCGLTVTNNLNSGPGSLRNTLLCASAGDTVRFAPALDGATITLLTTLFLQQDVTIYSTPADDITIDGTTCITTIRVDDDAEVTIAGLTILGGTEENGCAILNEGNLTLSSATVLSGPGCSKSTVANEGIFSTEGTCHIMD